ncbi:MAG: HEAT repeat domain-containing protein [Maioricimonas sp. JB049]
MRAVSVVAACLGLVIGPGAIPTQAADTGETNVMEVFERVRQHRFHPLNEDDSFTSDRTLGTHGVADLDDRDGSVRLLAIRDLVRQLPAAAPQVIAGLDDESIHVRQIVAAALGIARETSAIEPLQRRLREDTSSLVRSQAAMSLGQLEATSALDLLRERQEKDPSRDVQHQCELAVDQIRSGQGATDRQLKAFRELDFSRFGAVQVGQPAPDFTLTDTDGRAWQLRGDEPGRWTILIWVFADWCPVCHSEFSELIAMREQFAEADVRVATIECHDTYRCRVMVGKQIDPDYWFAKASFQDSYQKNIWWPHLSDPAGAVGGVYGVAPMSFAVHAEYINRPSVVIVDPEGVVRFAYYGTYWGDRPSIHQTLQMIQNEEFDFRHPKRLKVETP